MRATRRLRLTFRAYDEGVAFCYTLPAQDGLRNSRSRAENTRSALRATTPAWRWAIRAQGNYDRRRSAAQQGQAAGVERPLTVRIAEDLYASITEARLVDYARMKLRPVKDQPHARARRFSTRNGASTAGARARRPSPRRGGGHGGRQSGQVAGAELPDPELERSVRLADTSWIKPGKVIARSR